MKTLPHCLLVAVVAWASMTPGSVSAEPDVVKVYRSPSCGCCEKWAAHLESAGFEVELHEVRSLDHLKASHGVPPSLASCHTAIVDGYVVEGHVPAADVVRLLEERPPILGIAVPGMPIGSPGMEGPNPERYQVKSFDGSGRTEVFATHGP